MDLTYTSPIKFDFLPITGSTVIFHFKLKAAKKITKINVDTHIFYKDPYIMGKVFLANSGPQTVYTSSQEQTFSLKFKIPEFNQRIQSFINVSLENPYFQEKVIIEDMNIEADMTYAHPSVSLAVPNLHPKVAVTTTNVQPPDKLQGVDKIIIVSTWNINCGIATYTSYLLAELNKMYSELFIINPINGGRPELDIKGKLTHLQHEFGIMPVPPPNVYGKVIITWHTVPPYINDVIRQFESRLDVVAHIVHAEGARNFIRTPKDVYVVHHGSMLMPEITKDSARKILNLKNINMPIGFVFGFQSPNKNFNEIIEAARNTGIHVIISGARHISGHLSNLCNDKNVTFLDRHLTEEDINLYALASDILLFDYKDQCHYSCSGAMHRTIGAGRPVICSDIKHFSDINIAWKFKSQSDLEHSIINVLKNQEELGKCASEYAKETSWKNIAEKHIEIYRHYVNF